MPESLVDAQRRLIARLAAPAFHGPQCRGVRVVETHISFVILTGAFAYKIKKAVELGFLDFTTLNARRFFCQEEIRLNRRLAASIYLDVVPITGGADAPCFNGAGRAIEYAVRMREFPQHALLSAVIVRGGLTPDHLTALGERIAAFHGAARPALPHTRFGTAADVLELALDNFRDLDRLVAAPRVRAVLAALRRWTVQEHGRIEPLLETRRQHGRVRECHGDLHLGNIALVDGLATPFDCIEFSDRMRWSDVMSDVGFLMMDLHAHGRRDLADHFLNRYLEAGGDYQGLGVLRFFVAYRAGVRAKVAMLRAAQTPDGAERAAQTAAAIRFVRVAAGASREGRPGIVVMHGLSGSGKTTIANAAAAAVGGVHLRADVERKRLFGLSRLARTASTLGSGIYSAEATRRTYDRLATLARVVVECGYPAVVDAAFLKRWQRDRLRALAAAAKLPIIILDCSAPIATLAERVGARTARADDASEADQAVLAHQIDTAEPLAADERPLVVTCDTTLLRPGALPAGIAGQLTQRLQQSVTRERSAPDSSRAG